MKDELKELLTTATTGKGILDGVEIRHSSWVDSIRISAAYPGFIGVEEDSNSYEYKYVPMAVKKASKQTDLSQDFTFTIQDLNQIVGEHLDLIPIESEEKPQVILRTFVYREDGTISDIQDGPYDLQAGDITFSPDGCTFTASPPITNFAGTGEIFTFTRFPTLLAYSV